MSASSDLFVRAQKILVGGVDSPVRAFRAVGGEPLIIDRARGSRIIEADGRGYIDYVCSWGALILGHADPDVVAAVADQAARGTSYGMTSPLEIELGERIAALCRRSSASASSARGRKPPCRPCVSRAVSRSAT
jgi:glutamate-1-semialdehyde 2,1-aminomutase